VARDTILFDINETVLDLGPLSSQFEAAFGDSGAAATWFSMLLHNSTVCAMTGVKAGFAELADTMLTALAARKGLAFSDHQRDNILKGFAKLKAHPDVSPALKAARAKGYRNVAFTNSSRDLVTSQLLNSGLTDYFDEIISVEQIDSFKPDPIVYAFAARKLERPVKDLRLVAAHDWDTHGALAAGLLAAYVTRSKAPYHPLYRRPNIFADTMGETIEKIVADDAGAGSTDPAMQ
jgi:2-haloacid dehalogenase